MQPFRRTSEIHRLSKQRESLGFWNARLLPTCHWQHMCLWRILRIPYTYHVTNSEPAPHPRCCRPSKQNGSVSSDMWQEWATRRKCSEPQIRRSASSAKTAGAALVVRLILGCGLYVIMTYWKNLTILSAYHCVLLRTVRRIQLLAVRTSAWSSAFVPRNSTALLLYKPYYRYS